VRCQKGRRKHTLLSAGENDHRQNKNFRMGGGDWKRDAGPMNTAMPACEKKEGPARKGGLRLMIS